MKCELMLTYDTPDLRQTGSRNLIGPKTFPTICGTYMKLMNKYQFHSLWSDLNTALEASMLTIISLMQLCMFDVIKVYIFQFDLNRMLNALCSIKSNNT